MYRSAFGSDFSRRDEIKPVRGELNLLLDSSARVNVLPYGPK